MLLLEYLFSFGT